jgi:hypothetical protein
MGKFFERIINDRALKEAIITDAQAGGKKGRATTDHLLKSISSHFATRVSLIVEKL